MRKFLLFCFFALLASNLLAISPSAVEVSDTVEEIEVKKNKFLTIHETDLTDYEKIANQIDSQTAVGSHPSDELQSLKIDFNSYVQRRLRMISKIFAVFRSEYDNCLTYLESLSTQRLPAFADFIAVLENSIDEATIKGSKDKWAKLKDRASKLLQLAQNSDNRQNYLDNLVLNTDKVDTAYLEAKIRLLHRWLIEGRRNDATPWVEQLAKAYPTHPLCLGLQAHYWFEDYRLHASAIDYKAALEQKIEKQFDGAVSVTITLKGESSLQKAFLFYLEALKKGYPEQNEIPGLMPAYWQSIEIIYKKIHPYWGYPQHLKKHKKALEELTSKCRTIAEFVPFKKYASPAYKILDNVYRYWPESHLGNKIIDFSELKKLSNIVSKKKL